MSNSCHHMAHEDLASFSSWRVGSSRWSGILADRHRSQTLHVSCGNMCLEPYQNAWVCEAHICPYISTPWVSSGNPASFVGVWWLQTSWQDKNLSSPWINYHKTLTPRGTHKLCRQKVKIDVAYPIVALQILTAASTTYNRDPCLGQQWGVLGRAALRC